MAPEGGDAPSLIDTHCHLTHPRFSGEVGQVLARARAEGVVEVISIASSATDARDASLLTGDLRPEGAGVWFTAGIHPHEASGASPADAEVLARLRAHPRCVAVGECGLDFHYDFSPRTVQERVFEEQLQVAAEVDLPVVVHCREAEEAMIPRVREAGEGGVRGVLHCFPGDLRLLETAMDAGWAVSFTGLVTFRNFDGIEAVRAVPDGRYFLETDGPYMAPVPHRGKRNEPAFVPHIAAAVARIRGESPDGVARSTTHAAREFFGLAHHGRQEG